MLLCLWECASHPYECSYFGCSARCTKPSKEEEINPHVTSARSCGWRITQILGTHCSSCVVVAGRKCRDDNWHVLLPVQVCQSTRVQQDAVCRRHRNGANNGCPRAAHGKPRARVCQHACDITPLWLRRSVVSHRYAVLCSILQYCRRDPGNICASFFKSTPCSAFPGSSNVLRNCTLWFPHANCVAI